MATVTVHNDFYPEGAELVLPGLGSVKNGEAKEVTEAQITEFRSLGYEFPEKGDLELYYPPKPVKTKDLEPDAEVNLTDEELAELAGENKENN